MPSIFFQLQQKNAKKTRGKAAPPRLPKGSQSLKRHRSSFQAKDVHDRPTPAMKVGELGELGALVGYLLWDAEGSKFVKSPRLREGQRWERNQNALAIEKDSSSSL